MTTSIVASVGLVLSLAGLVYIHQRDIHRKRKARQRWVAELRQRQLDRAAEHSAPRDIDQEYADALDAAIYEQRPFDWAAVEQYADAIDKAYSGPPRAPITLEPDREQRGG